MSPAMHATQLHVLNSAHSLPLLARWSLAFAVTVVKWDSRARTRKHLTRLSDAHLKDIGIERYDARTESSKTFWQD